MSGASYTVAWLNAVPPCEWGWAGQHQPTWKIVFSSGLPAPLSRPMSLAHMLTSTTSATASAKRADWRSKEVSSSPRSRPSEPSRSITSVGGASTLGARASQMPLVV